ncbi:alpha/beta fold hydrolase [Streptomyces sp. NPDC005423]|uniref:alpha/beta hydrolase n=1 Tax=Streptomyces sp. NPDC005423 TaxID=3155343 RepID=UPI0033BD6899
MTEHDQALTPEAPTGAPPPAAPTAVPGSSPAALLPRRVPPTPRAAVLFLHGGTEHSRAPSRPWHLAAVRMRPFLRAVAATTPKTAGGVLLAEVRYRVRGWNGADADPLQDTHHALAELACRYGDLPTILVGHSMGGRTALRAAAAPQVRAVVALAPWCPEGEPVAHLSGKDVVIFHGDHDRVTDPHASGAFARRARAAGAARADMVLMKGSGHAMLRHGAAWHHLTGTTVADLLATSTQSATPPETPRAPGAEAS